MTTDFKTIYDTFDTELSLVLTEDVVRAYESYKPTTRQSYVRITVLPSESINISQGIDSWIEHSGLVQVDVITPANTETHFNIINTVVNRFNGKRKYPNALQIDRAWMGSSTYENDWIVSPVLCRYRYFVDSVGVDDI